MILADVARATRRFQNSVPGCPAEVVYRPTLTKPDRRDIELRELRQLLRQARDRLARADDLLAQAAANVMHAEQHHRAADCWKCATEQADAA